MSYLQATVLDEYRLPYAEQKMDLYEHRLANYGFYEAFRADTPNLLNARLLSEMKKAQGQTTSVPVIKTKDYTISTTRSCTAITNYNTSAFVAVTFATTRAGFTMIPSEYGYNQVDYMSDFRTKMDDMQKSILESWDTTCYTAMDTYKSAVNNAEDNPWPIVSNTIIVPNSDLEEIFNEAWAMMKMNNFKSDINCVASLRAAALIRKLNAQGPGNDQNDAYSLGGFNFRFSNNATVPAGYRDTLFFYPKGSLGFLTWIDPSSQMGEQSHNVKWSKEYLPLLGQTVGLMYQDSCADNSSIVDSGWEASKQESYIFSVDTAQVVAYNSDTTTYPGTIFKAQISKT